MKLSDIYLRIAPKKIAFLKFILEGYDGLATVTTLDRNEGLIRLLVPTSRYDELWGVLDSIAPECISH